MFVWKSGHLRKDTVRKALFCKLVCKLCHIYYYTRHKPLIINEPRIVHLKHLWMFEGTSKSCEIYTRKMYSLWSTLLKYNSQVFLSFNIQTKLHETVCDHRTLATIATHDVSSLVFPLEYEAVTPAEIQLVPLGRHKDITAEQLISDLRTEAMKQKQKTKRNPFKTGLYK